MYDAKACCQVGSDVASQCETDPQFDAAVDPTVIRDLQAHRSLDVNGLPTNGVGHGA